MASYTDNPEALGRFNPYVQQLPVEAMVEVGMKKQQMYNEGIQKIQTNIDNIGGLDIGRTVDKKYLQSKINELGNNLKTVAAGDFSDFQLVNSTTGMVNQIVKDPFVLAGVQSTANDRKQMAQMEEDKKKGTLTPQAEHYYNLKRQQYYNNENLKDDKGRPITFSGKYIQSWDLDKNVLEAVKAVGDSKWTVDKVFKMNPDTGKPLVDKNGAPIISEYAKREIRQGKFNENILAAIDSVLIRPEAKQELDMRGVYNYRGYDKIDDFVRGYEKEKETGIQLLEARKIDVMSKVAHETDPKNKEALQSLVGKIEGEITSLSQKSDIEIADAKQFSNVDAYKSALQTRKTRNDFLKGYVTETISEEIIKNIPYEVAQEKIKNDRDWWSKQQTISQGWTNIDLSRQKMVAEAKRWSESAQNVKNKKLLEGGGGPEVTVQPVNPQELLSTFMDKGETLSADFSAGKKDFVLDYLVALNSYNGRDLSRESIARDVDSWVAKDPKWIEKYYEKSKNEVNNAKGSKYADLKTKLPVMQNLQGALIEHGHRLDDINNDPTVLAAGGKEVDVTTVGKGFKPFEVEYEGYDPGLLFGGNRGLFQAQPKYKKTVTSSDAVNAGIVQNYSYLTHTPTEKALYDKAKEALEKKFEVPVRDVMATLGLSTTGSQAVQRVNPSLREIVKKVGSQKFTDVLRAKENVLMEKSKGNQPLSMAVYPAGLKGPERTSVDDRLKNVLTSFQNGGIDVSAFNNVYVGTKKEGFTTTIGIDRGSPTNPADTYTLDVYDGATKVQSVPINKEQANYIRGEDLQVPSRVSQVQEKIRWSGAKGTTNSMTGNLNSPSAYTGAHYPADYFRRNFNRSDVKGADIKINGMGEYNVYMYINDAQGNTEAIPVKGRQGDEYPMSFVSPDAADAFVRQQLTSSGQIDNILNNSK